MNRKQRRALGRSGAKPGFGAGGNAAQNAMLDALFGAALAQHRAGAFAEAALAYRHILTLFPAHAETNRMLGAALMAQNKAIEAIPYFERAIELRPDVLLAYEDLGRAQAAAGNLKLAISVAARALEVGETPQTKSFFAQCVRSARFTADDGRIRKLLQRAVSGSLGSPARTDRRVDQLDQAQWRGEGRHRARHRRLAGAAFSRKAFRCGGRRGDGERPAAVLPARERSDYRRRAGTPVDEFALRAAGGRRGRDRQRRRRRTTARFLLRAGAAVLHQRLCLRRHRG